MKYTLPEKELDRLIEIEGFETFELPLASFAEKMDFVSWLDKSKTENPQVILEKVINDTLPDDLAKAILETNNVLFITKIYSQIVSVKLGMSLDEYIKQSEKQA